MKTIFLLLLALLNLLLFSTASAQATKAASAPLAGCGFSLTNFTQWTDANESILGGAQISRDGPASQTVPFIRNSTNSPAIASLFNAASVTVTAENLSVALGGITVATAEFPIGLAANTYFFAPLRLTPAGARNYAIANTSGAMCRLPWATGTDLYHLDCSATLDNGTTLETQRRLPQNPWATATVGKDPVAVWTFDPGSRMALLSQLETTKTEHTHFRWSIPSDGNVNGIPFALDYQSPTDATVTIQARGTLKCGAAYKPVDVYKTSCYGRLDNNRRIVLDKINFPDDKQAGVWVDGEQVGLWTIDAPSRTGQMTIFEEIDPAKKIVRWSIPADDRVQSLRFDILYKRNSDPRSVRTSGTFSCSTPTM